MRKEVKRLIAVTIIIAVIGAIVYAKVSDNIRKEAAKQRALDAFSSVSQGGIKPEEYLEAVEDELGQKIEDSERVINGK